MPVSGDRVLGEEHSSREKDKCKILRKDELRALEEQTTLGSEFSGSFLGPLGVPSASNAQLCHQLFVERKFFLTSTPSPSQHSESPSCLF